MAVIEADSRLVYAVVGYVLRIFEFERGDAQLSKPHDPCGCDCCRLPGLGWVRLGRRELRDAGQGCLLRRVSGGSGASSHLLAASDGLTLEVGRRGRAQKGIHLPNRGHYELAGRLLRYGQTWTHPGYWRCVGRATGLTCSNHSGHGWWLGRRGSRVF